MDNDEINERLFKMFGWEKLPPPASPQWQMPTPGGVQLWYGNVPDFLHNDAAALSLLTGPVVEAGLEWELYSYGDLKACCINEPEIFGDHYKGNGPTVAAAICAAVLAWMDKMEGESNMTPPVEDRE